MPLTTDNYRRAATLLQQTGAFNAHPTDKKVLTLNMNLSMDNKELINLMAESLQDDLAEYQEDIGEVNKILCLGWLSTVVATTATYLDKEKGSDVIANATIMGYSSKKEQILGKINLDDRVMIISDVLYGHDLDNHVKLIKNIGARGAAVVAIGTCLDMEQNVLQCLAGRTTNEFMIGENTKQTESLTTDNDMLAAAVNDDEDVADTGILGIDILSLSVVVSHLVSANILDDYMIQRINFYINNEYNEWLALRDAELRSQNSRFFYQHDPVTWHYNAYLNTWNPNSTYISEKVKNMVALYTKEQTEKKNKDAKNSEENNTDNEANNTVNSESDIITPKDAEKKLDNEKIKKSDIPLPELYVNPIIMDLSNVNNWGIIKHRIQVALDTPIDDSKRVIVKDGKETEEPCGNISSIILNYNNINDWNREKAMELLKMRMNGNFSIISDKHNIYDTYNITKLVDIIMVTLHVSTLEDLKLFLENIKKGRCIRGDINYKHMLSIKFNKYTVTTVFKNPDFWNLLRECVLTTYASRTYHIAGILFDYADLSEVDKIPPPPKNYDLGLMIPTFLRTTGYYHHKSVIYGPKVNSDKDHIAHWEKLQLVLNTIGCSGLCINSDLVEANIPFDKKWVLYYKLLKKIHNANNIIELLRKWQYVAPLQNEQSSTEVVNVNNDNKPNNEEENEYEEDPDEIVNENGQTNDESRVAKEDKKKANENMTITIISTLLYMNRTKQNQYELSKK